MNDAELLAVAVAALGDAGLNPARPVHIERMIDRLWGPRCLRLVADADDVPGAGACWFLRDGRWSIDVPHALQGPERSAALAEACAGILLASRGNGARDDRMRLAAILLGRLRVAA